ncbi:MAG: transcription antitermination factor NusB [Peptococcaceae bacterium]|nr:transcription antitermination factor NusB [Peptococcaceae bacterium]
MGRRSARETAFLSLFQMDFTKTTPDQALEHSRKYTSINDEDAAFAAELISGVTANLPYLENILAKVSHDWRPERMAKTDRNIMLLALYEILFRDDIPDSVAVNEAIELAKTYGTGRSGRFVNGILGKVMENKEKFVNKGAAVHR